MMFAVWRQGGESRTQQLPSIWKEAGSRNKAARRLPRQKERAFISTRHKDQRRQGILALFSCRLLHLILAGAGDMNKNSFSNSRQKERAFISTCHKDQRRQGILALFSCRLLQKDKMAYLVDR
jgi:flavin reductase (DIM6/NTAB) family NADH-FMN oxidoreductase RutF